MTENTQKKGLSPFTRQVAELVGGPGITITRGSSIAEAAKLMAEQGVGSLVVLEGSEPVGMITKTDMVRRVLAANMDTGRKVDEVMTREIISIDGEKPLFDGLMLMIHNKISHLVVKDGEGMIGVVSERDWLTFQRNHPAALFQQMAQGATVAELAELRQKANDLVRALFAEEGTAAALTELVTEINDRVAIRVLELTLAEMAGPPPAPFAWIAMGSEGRSEQTLSTDQDNGLVFSDLPDAAREPARHWFLEFAGRVVEGLQVCGFPRCKGNIMASNPELCLSLSEWREMFARLIVTSDPEALLKASIYFDFRCLFGEPTLVDDLWRDLLQHVASSRGFLRYMTGEGEVFGGLPVNSLGWKLRRLVGMSPPPIDIKRQALSPMVRSLRAVALDCGVSQSNTLKRLELARERGVIPGDLADAARAAYDFVMVLRIRQHFRQQAQGESPSNLIDFKNLNRLQGHFLINALQTIADFEGFIQDKYGGLEVL
ncbi:MAG: DUF294 nucleotidyltransferase-like domain-containing protein [SAR324 cluster bacterium]|nr:DUF294 nucleotidyltransferase-like domain-containing protein [SAR324 cluster bacterium]